MLLNLAAAVDPTFDREKIGKCVFGTTAGQQLLWTKKVVSKAVTVDFDNTCI